MPTSLAAQLAQAVSLNAPLLSESARKKHRGTSYLFTSTSAQTEDIESIHALALNALGQLKLIYPAFRDFDSPNNGTYQWLFSAKAKETDRTLLAKEEAKALDDAVKQCLRMLGPCLLDAAAGKVIEWLVRRFRVNEFNVADVLTLFMPYHESPHFAKMVSILQLEDSRFAYLKPFKQAAKSLPRNVLANAMRKDVDLCRFIVNILSDSYGDPRLKMVPTVHRTLLAFNLATLLEFITQADDGSLDAATLSFFLPALLISLKVSGSEGGAVSVALRKDGVLGSFVLLSALSQKTSFTSQALSTIVTSMIKATANTTNSIDCSQLLTAVTSVLGPQTTLTSLSHNVCEKLIRIPGFGKAIQSAMGLTGSTKVIGLLIPYLTEKVDSQETATVVEQLISSKNVSDDIVALLANALLEASLNTDEESAKNFELLSALHQRHPDAFQHCVNVIGREDKERKLSIEKVLLKISASGGGANDVVLAATDADPSVRCAAVRSVLQRLSGEDLTEAETLALQESIEARLLDAHPSVIEVIYEEERIATSLFTQSSDLLTTVVAFLSSQQPSRALLRTHLQFFSGALYNAQPDIGLKVVLSMVLPFALLSKPRQKTAASVWEVVCGSPLSKHALLKGIGEIVQPVLNPGDEKSSLGVDEMVNVNTALISRLAENIQASDDFEQLINWLTECVQPGSSSAPNDAHVRLLALLVGGTLVSNLTNSHQTNTSRKLLDVVIKTGEVYEFDDVGIQEEFNEDAFEDGLVRSVVLKPNSRTSLQKAQLRLIARIPSNKQPSSSGGGGGGGLNWFCEDVEDIPPSDAYVVLMRDVYATINAVRPSGFVLHAIKKLFENTGPDVLLFLAGLWTSNAVSVTAVTKYIALKHALAFLQARQSAEIHVDFQVIVPSLVCALQEMDKRVRAAAMDCLSVLGSSTPGLKSSNVYAYDIIYGKSSELLQYVDSSDSIRYVQMLVEHRDHLANDSAYIAYVHNKELSYHKSDGKKESKYKQRILCYLFSHVICLPSKQTKVQLLTSLREVHSAVKLQMLEPLLRECVKAGEGVLQEHNNRDIILLSLTAFDTTCVKDLAADQSTFWALLLDCLKCFHLTEQTTALWASLLSHLVTIYNALPNSRQHDLWMTLITIGSSSDDSAWGVKSFLRKCIKQAAAYATILKELRPSTTEARLRESKRSKLDSTSSKDIPRDLSRLTFFAEALASQQLPGSLELVSELLEVLGQVVNGSAASQSDTGYTEQLLMSAIDSAASQVKELPNLSPNAIQLDVLVKLMRTDNPQTFNQALLLMASLARLSSESVLQNVLPIFTFMGSNIFHRDDSYSFKVVQKTTEGIVPVVMSTLRERFAMNHDLHIGARDLLKTFTDAAAHVPRHRRINFFIHLIDVMNPADFLAPTCMLLVDKVSTKVARQSPREALSALSLPLSIFENHTPANRLSATQEVLTEVRRLLSVVAGTDAPEKPFLEETTGDELASTIQTRKRQCRSLIVFVGHVLKQLPSAKLDGHERDVLRHVLASLVDFSTVQEDKQVTGGDDLTESARWSLLNALETIPVDEFASAILAMVQGADRKLQEGSLLLLAERFQDITPSARERIQNTTAQILDCIQSILLSANERPLIKSALDALRAIATTAQTKDETPLVALVPTILQIVRGRLNDLSALSVLPILILKLGPRMIPHLRSIIDACVSVANAGSSLEMLAEDFKVLTALVTSISTFWGSAEVKAVCEIYINDQVGGFKSTHCTEKLVKAISKHISSKLLLASLLELWPSAHFVTSSGGEERTERFFDLLKRCIHHSGRSDMQEVLRSMFSHFLQSFDYRTTVSLTNLSVEDKVIGAYMELVIKLNETTFQPLFRRSCDWAFGVDSNVGRKITFFRTFTALLELFKDLMTPYMTFVLEPLADLLRQFGDGTVNEPSLWTPCMDNLSKSLVVDEGTFWNDDRVRTIYAPVVQQIPVCIRLKIENGKALLTDSLLSLLGCADGDPLLKAINLAVIQQSKSEDARIRLLSLSCSVAIWQKMGRKLSGFGIQTATFVMECSEDDNDDVVRECRRLRDAIEAQVGKIEGL